MHAASGMPLTMPLDPTEVPEAHHVPVPGVVDPWVVAENASRVKVSTCTACVCATTVPQQVPYHDVKLGLMPA